MLRRYLLIRCETCLEAAGQEEPFIEEILRYLGCGMILFFQWVNEKYIVVARDTELCVTLSGAASPCES